MGGGGGSSGGAGEVPESWTSQTTSPQPGTQALLDRLLADTMALADKPYQPYEGQMVAPQTAFHHAAYGQGENNINNVIPGMDAAYASMAGGGGGGAYVPAGLQSPDHSNILPMLLSKGAPGNAESAADNAQISQDIMSMIDANTAAAPQATLPQMQGSGPAFAPQATQQWGSGLAPASAPAAANTAPAQTPWQVAEDAAAAQAAKEEADRKAALAQLQASLPAPGAGGGLGAPGGQQAPQAPAVLPPLGTPAGPVPTAESMWGRGAQARGEQAPQGGLYSTSQGTQDYLNQPKIAQNVWDAHVRSQAPNPANRGRYAFNDRPTIAEFEELTRWDDGMGGD